MVRVADGSIRIATVADAFAIGSVHVEAWGKPTSELSRIMCSQAFPWTGER